MKTLYWLVGLGTLVIVLGNEKVRHGYNGDNDTDYLIVGAYGSGDESVCVHGGLAGDSNGFGERQSFLVIVLEEDMSQQYKHTYKVPRSEERDCRGGDGGGEG